MTPWRLRFAWVYALFLLLVWSPLWVNGNDTSEFLLISDIHFDPFFDKSLFKELVEQPIEDWPSILAKSHPSRVSQVGEDSNYALLRSTLDNAHRRIPNPDFILYPGDFLCHGWQSKYDGVAKQSHREDPVAYRQFTAKVIRFLAAEFRQRYPNTPIFPAMGNDDSLCGDYMLTPDGPFLKMFAAVWAPLIDLENDAVRRAFRETFSSGGCYTLKLPHLDNHRLIVFNSIFFSKKYDNACGSKLQTPATAQLRWLAEKLQEAKKANEKVWLLTHIPIGLNGYSTAKSVVSGGPADAFWQPEPTARFIRLVHEHQGMIQVTFSGHTHMDDYRVVRLKGQPVLLTKIAPGVSPIFGNNPGYQMYEYNRASGSLNDFQTHYLNISTTDGKATPAAKQRWTLEYSFRRAYSLGAVTANSVSQLADGIASNRGVAKNYMRFYSVSGTPQIASTALDIYRCVITNVTPAEFHSCCPITPQSKRPPVNHGSRADAQGKPTLSPTAAGNNMP